MRYTRQNVSEMTKALSSRWSLFPSEPRKPLPSEIEQAVETVMNRAFLQEHGTSVAVYETDREAMSTWCHENAKGRWALSVDPVISTPQTMELDLKLARGEEESNWSETLWTKAIERMTARDEAQDAGDKFIEGYYWFENRDEAMLFKLIWGGE